jgi:hypothetical protein
MPTIFASHRENHIRILTSSDDDKIIDRIAERMPRETEETRLT